MTRTPHDALFKYVFSKPEHAAGEFRAALPSELVAALDLDQLEEKSESLLGPDLTTRHCDLLFQAKLKDEDTFLFLLHEHQSTALERIAVRALIYLTRALDRWLRDHPNARRVPAALALVLHQGPDRWSAPTEVLPLYDVPIHLRDTLGPHLPNVRVLIDDLATRSDEELRARDATSLGKLGWLLLKHGRDGDLTEERLRSWSDLFLDVDSTSSDHDLQALGS